VWRTLICLARIFGMGTEETNAIGASGLLNEIQCEGLPNSAIHLHINFRC
jgi:hypothetical protein